MKQLSFVVKNIINENNVPVKQYIPKIIDGGVAIDDYINQCSEPYPFSILHGEIVGKGICKGLEYVVVERHGHKSILIPIDGTWSTVIGQDGYRIDSDDVKTVQRLIQKGFAVTQAEKEHNRDGIWF